MTAAAAASAWGECTPWGATKCEGQSESKRPRGSERHLLAKLLATASDSVVSSRAESDGGSEGLGSGWLIAEAGNDPL